MTGTTYDGYLALMVKGRSWRRSQRPPLQVTILERPDRLLAIATDQSGGQRGGDRVRTEVTVAEEGWLDWMPPSSPLYFPSADRQKVCSVETQLTVEAGSRLSWCPPISIPCGGAIIDQKTRLTVGLGAEFLYWDGWADGRTASGERKAFKVLSNHLELSWGGRIVFRERWTLLGTQLPPDTDPAGYGGACQWHLGLASGPISRLELAERVSAWVQAGQAAEMGELASGLWIARALCRPGVTAWKGARRAVL